jgi:hypothetical protein
MTAIGAEEFDLLVAKFLIVAIELALALRTGHPEYFRHIPSWCQIIFTTEAQSTQSSEYFLIRTLSLAPSTPPW